jgi:hypothetical protein
LAIDDASAGSCDEKEVALEAPPRELSSKERPFTAGLVDRAPVPAPPKQPLAKYLAAPLAPPSKGREHEVRRLIRDLAVLAALNRPPA